MNTAAQQGSDPQPSYLGDRTTDDLARMVTELTSEVWILRDRMIVLEHLLADLGHIESGLPDRYQPDAELSARLTTEREELVERVLGAPHGGDYSVDSLVAKGHR